MPNNGWLRAFFAFVLLQAFILVPAVVWPKAIEFGLPWPATPLNARFVAALYCMGAVTSLLSIFAGRYSAVRISVVMVGAITGGLLVLTLPYLGDFTKDTFPYRWIVFYTVDAVVTIVLLWRWRGRDPVPAGRGPAAPILWGYATILAVAGAVMLVAPSFAVRVWPWGLTSVLAQVYSVFFLVFALGGVLAARDPRTEAIWIYLVANVTTVLIVIGISLSYPERFKSGLPTVVWYVLWGAAALALAGALGLATRRAGSTPAAVAP